MVSDEVERRSSRLGDAVTIERTFDYALVRSFITHPRVYRQITDDACVSVEKFSVNESDQVIYALVKCDGKPVGVFVFVPENSFTLQVHTCLSPAIWGAAFVAAREAARWVFETTNFVRINTQVPFFNVLAARLSLLAGMELYGVCPRSFMKNGTLWDVALYGMSKGG